jgi:hypothetical protein
MHEVEEGHKRNVSGVKLWWKVFSDICHTAVQGRKVKGERGWKAVRQY